MPLPTFLIIGAPKCGTTSLAAHLARHPEVFFSPWKEPNYFALAGHKLPHNGPASPEVLYAMIYFHCATDFAQYQHLFDGARGQRAIGEGSVRYLYYPEAAPRIRQTLPNVRMVAILREPVSRLYSHYCMMRQFQLEPLPLREAIEAEERRIADNWGWDWHYTAIGRYAEQIRRYFDLFGREQLKVVLYDDLVARPLETYQDICRHIGISDTHVPDMSKKGKVAYRPRNLTIDRWLHWPNRARDRIERILPRRVYRKGLRILERLNRTDVPKLDRETRAELAPLFREHNDRLADVLGREIPWNKRT